MDIKSRIKEKLMETSTDHGFSEAFVKAKKKQDELDLEVEKLGKELNKFPRLPNGMYPDHIRALPEWKEAKQKVATALNNLRTFNKTYTQTFKRELQRKYGYGPKPF